MQFEDKIRALSEKAKLHSSHILTEEAAKTALVMPFISALGYDVFDPREVVPEFIADVGVKKGEKVDYAIHHNGVLSILVECKPHGVKLDQTHLSQLYRYFSVTSARFAILTNGLTYQFYTDLDAANVMDKRPFLVFDLSDLRPDTIVELAKFKREAFDVDGILATANSLKMISAIKAELRKEMEAPSDEFVRLFAGRILDGRRTSAVMTKFAEQTRLALTAFVNDIARQRLSDALDPAPIQEVAAETPSQATQANAADESDSEIVTTQEESEAFMIIKAIVRSQVSAGRVGMRDQKSYCAILIDDNNRKPLARLHFNRAKKYLGLFDADVDPKLEARYELSGLDDIFQYADKLLATARRYA